MLAAVTIKFMTVKLSNKKSKFVTAGPEIFSEFRTVKSVREYRNQPTEEVAVRMAQTHPRLFVVSIFIFKPEFASNGIKLDFGTAPLSSPEVWLSLSNKTPLVC